MEPSKPKIITLLPSATEICFLLGLGDQVVGVSHECDFPLAAKELPILTRPKLDSTGSALEIDRQVQQLVNRGLSVYSVDEDLLQQLQPDIIITQDTCEVCAVSLEEVKNATCRLLGKDTQIVSLSPLTVADVFRDIGKVGQATGIDAKPAVTKLKQRLEALRRQTAPLKKPRTLMVEWTNPLMIAGHWTPELVECAGGIPILGNSGAPTGPIKWDLVFEAQPEVIILAPCGFKISQTLKEMPEFMASKEVRSLPAVKNHRVYLIDGNAYFNRPGPRLVDSAEIAAQALHPDLTALPSVSPQDMATFRL